MVLSSVYVRQELQWCSRDDNIKVYYHGNSKPNLNPGSWCNCCRDPTVFLSLGIPGLSWRALLHAALVNHSIVWAHCPLTTLQWCSSFLGEMSLGQRLHQCITAKEVYSWQCDIVVHFTFMALQHTQGVGNLGLRWQMSTTRPARGRRIRGVCIVWWREQAQLGQEGLSSTTMDLKVLSCFTDVTVSLPFSVTLRRNGQVFVIY